MKIIEIHALLFCEKCSSKLEALQGKQVLKDEYRLIVRVVPCRNCIGDSTSNGAK